MKLNKKKILQAIESTENWINLQIENDRADKYTETGGLTIYGCEVRNLAEYKEMLSNIYTQELNSRLLELYKTI